MSITDLPTKCRCASRQQARFDRGHTSCTPCTPFAEFATAVTAPAYRLDRRCFTMKAEQLMEGTHPPVAMSAVEDAATTERYGALIRMARTARRLTLAQAGTLLGYSASTLSRIETGHRPLTDITELRHFAETL